MRWRATPVWASVTVTEAPTTAAPVLSVTVPVMVPVPTCAISELAVTISTSTAKTAKRNREYRTSISLGGLEIAGSLPREFIDTDARATVAFHNAFLLSCELRIAPLTARPCETSRLLQKSELTLRPEFKTQTAFFGTCYARFL